MFVLKKENYVFVRIYNMGLNKMWLFVSYCILLLERFIDLYCMLRYLNVIKFLKFVFGMVMGYLRIIWLLVVIILLLDVGVVSK